MAVDRNAKFLQKNPNAVATDMGWVDSETGELLVSIRGLPNARIWDRKGGTIGGKAYGTKFAAVEKASKSPKKDPVETVIPVETVTPDVAEAIASVVVDAVVTPVAVEQKAAPAQKATKKTAKAKKSAE